MRRKTIVWIVAAMLAAAVLAAVGLVAYHAGFHQGATRSVAVGPLRRFGFVTPRVVVGGGGGFSAAASLLLLLIGGAVGAAIGYLAWGGRAAGAAVAQPATGATVAQPTVVAAAAGPVDPLWQQFDEWHRSVHAAPTAGTAAEGVAAPSSAPPPAAPQPPAAPEPPAQPSDGT